MITWELFNSVICYSWFTYRTLPDIISKCCCTVLSVYGSSMPQNHFDPDGSEPSSNHIFWLLGHPRAEGGRPGGGAAVHSLFGTLIVGNLRILEQITFYLNGIFPLVTVFSISSDPVFIHCFIFAPKVADKSLSWHVGHVFFSTSPSQPHLHSWKLSLVTLQLNFWCFTRETPDRRTIGFFTPKTQAFRELRLMVASIVSSVSWLFGTRVRLGRVS